MLRWQDESPDTRAPKRAKTSNSTDSSSMHQARRDRLELELEDQSWQVAALVVLQSLYAVKPLPELLSDLSQEQQLQAAVLADKWLVPHVTTIAGQLLSDAVSTADGLADAVQQRILQGPPLPDSLQPLVKYVLSPLCDLEAAWADARLRDQLLALSLPVMELLLSSPELKVRLSGTTSLYAIDGTTNVDGTII
jgi:hypothetical protein